MSTVWTRANEHNVTETPAVEGGDYSQQGANPGHKDGAAFVRQLIGDGAKVETTGRSIEYWTGDSMSDTGLAYNISGRATVIEAGVGERLAGFQDPIKAIFGTSICQDKTVIVKRKYVVGGAATITPERAPARTVQVREDVQSVELQRYGGDVTMNTNLFLSPGDAQAEMNMKLDAQKKQLENKLVELGYNEIFDKALRLPDVAVRSNPTFSSHGDSDVDSPAARAYARTVYFRSCFGAFAKHEFPLANLLASCKTSGAYTSADGDATVLVIPHGSSEMLRYTKSSSMNYSISGLRTSDQKPVTMAIDNVAEDPSSGVKIMVHVPPTSYARSAALPSTDKGMLSEDVSIYMVYSPAAMTNGLIPNLQDGGWKAIPRKPSGGAGPTFNNIAESRLAAQSTNYNRFLTLLASFEAGSPLTQEERRQMRIYFAANSSDTTPTQSDVEERVAKVRQGQLTQYLGVGQDDTLLSLSVFGLSFKSEDDAVRSAPTLSSLVDLKDIKQKFVKKIFESMAKKDALNTIQVAMHQAINLPRPKEGGVVKDEKTANEIYADVTGNKEIRHYVAYVQVLKHLLAVRASQSPDDKFGGNIAMSFDHLYDLISTMFGSSGSPIDLAGSNASGFEQLSKSIAPLSQGNMGILTDVEVTTVSRFVYKEILSTNSVDILCSNDQLFQDIKNKDFAAAAALLNSSTGSRVTADTVQAAYDKDFENITKEIKSSLKVGSDDEILARLATQAVCMEIIKGAIGKVVRFGDSRVIGFYEVIVEGKHDKSNEPSFLSKFAAVDWYQKADTLKKIVTSPGAMITLKYLNRIFGFNKSAFANTIRDTIKSIFHDYVFDPDLLESSTSLTQATKAAKKEKADGILAQVVDIISRFYVAAKDGLTQNGNTNGSWTFNFMKAVATDAIREEGNKIVENDTKLFEMASLSDDVIRNNSQLLSKLAADCVMHVFHESGNAFADLQALSQITDGGILGLFNAGTTAAGLTEQDISNGTQERQLSRNGLSAINSTTNIVYVRELRVKMSSAIIAKSGSDTGELLVGYPMTGVSTNQRTESMTVALRVYLGAILKKPENVTIIPHVAFEGIVKHDDWFYASVEPERVGDPASSNGIRFTELGTRGVSGELRTGYAYPGTWAEFNNGKYEIKQENTGPLGHLDDPYYMECVNGLQVYKAAPVQTISYNKYNRA